MAFIKKERRSNLKLVLQKDLTRSLKRGNPWVFRHSLKVLPLAQPGSLLELVDKKGKFVAWGLYDPHCALAFRALSTERKEKITNLWIRSRLEEAIARRDTIHRQGSDGYRLVHGEGDRLPGFVCDLYDKTAVIRLDGEGPMGFYNLDEIAQFLLQKLELESVYQRFRNPKAENTDVEKGELLAGIQPPDRVTFQENHLQFLADIRCGQKTGFFFDQRDNRKVVGCLSLNKTVLNVFSYTGAFSVYAGFGGASHVTSVDLSADAIEDAKKNWKLNDLPALQHETITEEAFAFLEHMDKRNRKWDMVILDPPSFAPHKASLERAKTSYKNLIAFGARVTKPSGLLIASSCSSHLSHEEFLKITEEGISQARKKGRLLYMGGQGIDHPAPLPLPEFRYLKFNVVEIDR